MTNSKHKMLSLFFCLCILVSMTILPTMTNAATTSVTHSTEYSYTGKCGENLTYSFDESTGTLTISGTGEMYNSDWSDHPEWNSFRDGIKSLIIENGVTSIRKEAFFSCTNLSLINLPNSITTIAFGAFSRCTNLRTVDIPDNIKTIDYGAFSGCTSLSAINLPDSVTTIGERVFSGCTSLSAINIPNSVTIIGNKAFYQCTSLKTINIPDNVKSIGYNTFYGCTSLKTVRIPDNIKTIGYNTFSGCTSLSTINIPDSVIIIGSAAFSGCTSLSTINIPDSVTTIDDFAFSGCTSLKTVNIADSVTSIGGYAFYNCENLCKITIPNNTTIIGSYAFCGCTNLISVYIHPNVNRIDSYSFGYYVYDNRNLSTKKYQDFVIYGENGSEAEKYANKNGFKFITGKPVQTSEPIVTEPTEIKPIEPIVTEPNITESLTNETECTINEPVTDKPTESTVTEPTEIKSTEPVFKEKTDISCWKVNGIKSKTYTGKRLTQNITVTHGGKTATVKISYKNNINAGTATVTINGIGIYTGKIVKIFKINKAIQRMKIMVLSKSVKFSLLKNKAQTIKKAITVTKSYGKATYTKIAKESSKYLTISKGGVITVKKKAPKGIFKMAVKVTAKGNKNYKSASRAVKVTIKIK